jgi:hypothetical protein
MKKRRAMNAAVSRPRNKKSVFAAIGAALISMLFVQGCTVAVFPPAVAGKPYVRLYGRAGDTAVWIVNGSYIRQNLDEEFTNFGQHYGFRFIPKDEFWLDDQGASGEESFFIEHLLVERRLMAGGMAYDPALDEADKVEQAARDKTPLAQEGETLLKSGRRDELIARIHQRLLSEFSGGVKVWIVDGELVRDVFDIDFTEGGHDKVYSFVPANEVWLDNDVLPGEREFILLHEMHERHLMSLGWKYAEAHADSSRIEYDCRRHPERLEKALRAEVEKNR